MLVGPVQSDPGPNGNGRVWRTHGILLSGVFHNTRLGRGHNPYSRVLEGQHLRNALCSRYSAWLETLVLTIAWLPRAIRSQALRVDLLQHGSNHRRLSIPTAGRFPQIHRQLKERKRTKKKATAITYSDRCALNTYKARACALDIRAW